MTRIERVDTLVCHARMRNWVFVKVVTSDDGLWGWGEATLEWHTREVVAAVEDLATLLLGQDPTQIERLWQSVESTWRCGTSSERYTASPATASGVAPCANRFASIAIWAEAAWRTFTR